jgi:hypothetical protein
LVAGYGDIVGASLLAIVHGIVPTAARIASNCFRYWRSHKALAPRERITNDMIRDWGGMMMNPELELSAQVLNAIHAGRKIDAIKLLRKERGLGLKEAKDIVDAYTMANPQLVVQRRSSGGTGAIMVVLAIAAAAYAAYRFFA